MTPTKERPARGAGGASKNEFRKKGIQTIASKFAADYPGNLPNDGAAFVSGCGQYHTDEPGKENRKPYLSVTLAAIREMADDPPSVPKAKGQWFIPSTLPSRTFATQEANGEFWMLWADLDHDPKPLKEVCDLVAMEIVDMSDVEVYASRSAREDYQKGRVLVPLARPVSGADWLLCQKVLNDKLEAYGIAPDRKSEGCAQLCYLPNRGEFYVSHSWRHGDYFDPLTAWCDEIEAARAQVAPRRNAPDLTANTGDVYDPVVDYLYDMGLVVEDPNDGRRLFVECPNSNQHTSDTGNSSVTWFRAGSHGHAVGHFDCKHDHCKHIDTSAFKRLIGYDEQGFEVLDVSDEEYNHKSPGAIRAARAAVAVIEKAKFTSGRTALEEARREHQKLQNERIGEGEHTIPSAEVISLATALNRFVFLSDGSRVADIFNPHYDLSQNDFVATFAASKESIPQPDKVLANGRTVRVPDKEIPVSKLWAESPQRKTAVCRTFKAGGNLVLNDPDGRPALNSWRPFDRTLAVDDLEAAGVHLFVDHVDFLFGTDAPRFLDWLAHIEQDPGTLPHTAWLHIAKRFGMGRNWLASVLARVWAGSVAANLDLVGTMKTGFNGALSRKVLAVVDEIREGGRDTQWEHSETLKRTINEEHRRINPKYGRQSIEFNACRFLMFSNHLSAIPMEDTDRRIEVVVSDRQPKGADYYKMLYAALNRPEFIGAVASLLAARDTSKFNPGAHALQTEGKKAATKASQTPTAAYCETLADHWPSDLITSSDLYFILTGLEPSAGASLNAGHRRTLEQYGITAMGKARKIGGDLVRISIVRNRCKWAHADTDAVRDELQKARIGMLNARDYLDECAAGLSE